MPALSKKKRVLFAAAALVLTLAGAETVLRLYDFSFYFNFGADLLGMPLLDLHRIRRIMNRSVDFDPHLFWRFKPNQRLETRGIYRRPVTINSLGFRGAEFSPEKPPDTFRLACIGDSTTFGWSVGDGETYPARLLLLLGRDCPAAGVEVLNLGVTGYTSLQGRELMTRYVINWQPDLVVFAFGPNDRLPALKSDQEHLDDRTWDIGSVQVFLHRFQLYKLLKAGVVYLENRARGLSLDPATYLPRLKRKVSAAEFGQNVAQVKRSCDQIGAGLVIIHVDYPSLSPDHVTAALEDEARRAGASLPGQWSSWDGQALVRGLSRQLGVPSLDLRELFSRDLEKIQRDDLEPERARLIREAMPDEIEAEPWRYLMVDNGHPNEWGHEIIARALAEIVTGMPAFEKSCRAGSRP